MGDALATATVAIFTPTYNRAYKLPDLYASLLKQTCQDFVWIVIDDGSTDGTQQLIQTYIDAGIVPIRYVYQDNGGKQRAHNTAVSHCEEELFFTVDSDDYLVDTAIEQITNSWRTYTDKSDIAGIVALCGKSMTEPLNGQLPDGVATTTVYGLYSRYRFAGDAALIYRTAVLKQYPYDVIPGEKFIAESYVYLQIDDDYKLGTLNSIVMVREYLPDGYTRSARKIARDNPLGYMKVKKLYMDRATTLRDRLESTTLYLVGAIYAHRYKEALRTIDNPLLALASGTMALILVLTAFRGQ